MKVSKVTGYLLLGMILAAGILFFVRDNAWAEEVTLTTYYPAPYGVYNDLVAMNSLGIGTTSPNSKLDIIRPGEVYDLGTSSHYDYYTKGVIASLVSSANNVNSAALIDFNAYNATGGATGIFLGAVAGPTGNAAANFIVGRRTGIQTWVESLRIDTAGNVGIGTTSPNPQAYGGTVLDVMTTTGSNIGAINIGANFADADNTSYGDLAFINTGTSSTDKRLVILRANTDGTTANERGGELVVYTKKDGSANFNTAMVIDNTGNVGIGTTDPHFGLDVRGAMGFIGSGDNSQSTGGWRLGKATTGGVANQWVYLRTADGTVYQDLAVGCLYMSSGYSGTHAAGAPADIAEMTPVREKDNLESGDVVCIDKTQSVRLTKSVKPYDTNVAGIISNKAALTIAGEDPVKDKERTDLKPIALVGRVPCKVTTENGSIEIGDLLVTSSKPGYAMKADIDKLKPGMVLGKAMEPLKKGEGKIVVWLQK